MNEFLPPADTSLAAANDTLLEALPIAGDGAHDAERTFYDTFDGLLAGDGLELALEDGRLSLSESESGRLRATGSAAAVDDSWFPGELDPGPLRDALSSICGVRALLKLVRVHSRVRTLRMLDDERKTVVRLSLEEPAVIGPPENRRLRPRLRLIAVRGYDEELERVHRRLERELGFTPAAGSLVDEAVRAAGGTPGGVSSKVRVPLKYTDRADAAVSEVLLRLLDVVEANLDGTVADIDSEFLHDLRVSIRRSRAVQRELKKVFPRQELDAFRDGFRSLQRATGEGRDLDVYVLEFETFRAMLPAELQADLDPLLEVLRERREHAHDELTTVLRSKRTTRLLSDWRSFLDFLSSLPTDDRPAATDEIGVVAGRRIAKVYKRMVKLGSAIDDSSPAEDLHELRKQGKELRYLLELFATPVYPEDVVKPMVKTLKALQDTLGRHQDREVQTAMLRSIREDVAARPNGPAAVMAMGVLVERLHEDEQEARRDFHARFETFSSKSQRKLVKETFR